MIKGKALSDGGLGKGMDVDQRVLTMAPSFLPRIRPKTGFSANAAFLFSCLWRLLSAFRLSLAN